MPHSFKSSSFTHSFQCVQGWYLTTPSGKEAMDKGSGGEEETILFNFRASSPIELSVTGMIFLRHNHQYQMKSPCIAGDTVQVIGEDDGSGWVKVMSQCASGLVPASYIQIEKKLPVWNVKQTEPIRKSVTPPQMMSSLPPIDLSCLHLCTQTCASSNQAV